MILTPQTSHLTLHTTTPNLRTQSKGQITFTKTDEGTRVDFKTYYPSKTDLEKITEMGFEQGITICHDQLENLLKG